MTCPASLPRPRSRLRRGPAPRRGNSDGAALTARPGGPAPAIPAMETYRSTPATTAVVPMTPAPAAAAVRAPGERVKASPLARKIAAQSGVDLRLVPRQRSGRPHRAARRRGGVGAGAAAAP